jgi:hypothetical protein
MRDASGRINAPYSRSDVIVDNATAASGELINSTQKYPKLGIHGEA